MHERLTIGFTSKLVPVKPINEQMTLCKCYVMSIGKNRNKSNITKEAAEAALPTLFNIPVVGHLYVDDDNVCRMGGHDMALERDSEGKYKFRMLTVPYGTVPQQDNVHYEEVTESNGEVRQYQVADIILWTGRYPELLEAKYSDGIYFAQSMEIVPMKTSKSDGYTNIEKFQYSALCLLGKSDEASKNVEPCFESARVEPYEFSVTEEWIKLFGEFKAELTKSFGACAMEEKKKLNDEKIKSILSEFGLSDGVKLPFELKPEMSEEDLRRELSAHYSSNKNSAEKSETDNGNDKVPVRFAVELTYEEKRKKINEALNVLCKWDEQEYRYYGLVDFDTKYVYSCYHIGGENISEESGTLRIPYSVGEPEISIELSRAEKVRPVWLTKSDEEKLNSDREQLERLRAYESAKKEEERRKEYAAVIAEFSDLGELDEYKAVVKDAMTFESAESLSEKLYAIRGKYAKRPGKKSLSEVKIPVGFGAGRGGMSEVDEFMQKYLPGLSGKN